MRSLALGRCGAYKPYTNDTAEDTIQAYYSFPPVSGGKLCPNLRKLPSVIGTGLKVNIKLKKYIGFKVNYRK